MTISPIYAITDPQLLPGAQLLQGVEAALRGGIRTIQYRDKTGLPAMQLDNAYALADLCRNFSAQLIINDNPILAKKSGAHGVHLGQEDGSIASARAYLGDGFIVGATCHHLLDLARQAIEQGADYVAFGRFFPSQTKPQAGSAPVSLLHQATATFKVPVVAIGGITLDNMAPLVHAGAHSLAVCHSLFAADPIEARARALLQAYLTCSTHSN